MLKKVLHALFYLAKAYLLLVGLIVTVMVGRQLYLDRQGSKIRWSGRSSI